MKIERKIWLLFVVLTSVKLSESWTNVPPSLSSRKVTIHDAPNTLKIATMSRLHVAFLSSNVESEVGAADARTVDTTNSSSSSSNVQPTTLINIVDGDASNPLTHDLISKLRFRELCRELEARQLSTDGTTSQLRERLKQVVLPNDVDDDECVVNEDDMGDDCTPPELEGLVTFIDESDPDYEFKELIRECETKASKGHWKAATRKLKKLTRRYATDRSLPESVYLRTLEACMENRLQGARASEPARKILEQMYEQGYTITEKVGNYCIKNCLGDYGPQSTHQGFGGIDTALAMLAVLEQVKTPVQLETYEKILQALAKEGSVDQAVVTLRRVVVDKAETPALTTFVKVAGAALNDLNNKEQVEKVLSVLAYAKAAGYELDKIASVQDGRNLLACGVVAAEALNNDALGFRLLTAASKAANVEPDRGDIMVALSGPAAQRACTLIHKRAIIKASEDGEWKLAVKVLQLMLERSLKPSPWLWRNVVTCCAKAEKSRKATSLLLDWIKLHEGGKIEIPPLSVFNTCVNACEICDEHELTLVVLDAMKKTHNTEGNLITFNIALKRLAKLGNEPACEGIIIGMLQAGIEPSVVSYTTAIAACVSGEKQPANAYEWLKRMRTRKVSPNVLTYNTALAACIDGKLESTRLGSKIAEEMLADVDAQLADDSDSYNEYTNVVPDMATKTLARRLMEQLKKNWEEGDIDKRVATDTVRVPLKRLVDFQKSEAAEKVRQKTSQKSKEDEDQALVTRRNEEQLEYETAARLHRSAEV